MALDDGSEIADLSRPFYVRLLELAWVDAAAAGFVDGAFDVDMPEVQEILGDLGKLIRAVAETTRTRVQELQGEAAREGWSVDELAARYEEAGLFGRDRALLIANTESARAHTLGSIAAYRASEVVDRLEWLVTEPCDECAPLAGKIVALGEEFAPGIAHPPAHPSCRCAVAPVVAEAA